MTQPIYQNYDRVICECVEWKTTCNMHLYYEYQTSFREVLVELGVKRDADMRCQARKGL